MAYQCRDDIINNLCSDIFISNKECYYIGNYITKKVIISQLQTLNQLLLDIKNNFVIYGQNSILKIIRLNMDYSNESLKMLLDILIGTHNTIKLHITSAITMDICVTICKLIKHNKVETLWINEVISENASKLLGNTIKNSKFIKELIVFNHTYNFLSFLKYNNTIKKIGVDKVKPLYKTLKYNKSIDNVSLTVTLDNIKYVVKILHNKNIKKVELCVKPTEDLDFTHILKAISNNTTIQKLMFNCDIYSSQKIYAKYLINFITHNTMLKKLWIRLDCFDLDDIKHIIYAINKNSSLEFFDIGFISVTQIKLVFRCLQKNKILTRLCIDAFEEISVYKYIIELANIIPSLHTIKHYINDNPTLTVYYNTIGVQMLKFNPRIIIDAPQLSGPILDLCNRNKHNYYQKNVTLLELLYIF